MPDSVSVRGAAETADRLRGVADELGAGLELDELAQAMRATALSIVRRRTGRLAGTIRAEAPAGVARLVAGGLPYAGVQEFGGYHGISPNHFLRGALEQARSGTATQLVGQEVAGIIRRNGLRP
jgi:hypothetical protein